jgi:hypothetical protein
LLLRTTHQELDNLLLSQVDKSTTVNEPYLPVFTDEEKAQLRKSRLERADRIALLKTKGDSSAAPTKEVSKTLQESKDDHFFPPINFGSAERRVLWDKKKDQKRAVQEEQAKFNVTNGLTKAPNASSGKVDIPC